MFGLLGFLAAVSAIHSFVKKEIPIALLFVVVLVACTLYIVSVLAHEPVATFAGWTSITMSIALLVALALARILPKDNGII